MRKILIAMLCLMGAIAGAQTPGPVNVTYSPNNPNVISCNKGASWFNTTTNHWWVCDISTTPPQFVDTSVSFPITVTLGSNTGTINLTSTLVTLAVSNATNQTSHIVTATGSLDQTTGTKPTCNVSNRQKRWFTPGAEAVADAYEICMKDSTDTFDWVPLATP